jgi:hypothetical protein
LVQVQNYRSDADRAVARIQRPQDYLAIDKRTGRGLWRGPRIDVIPSLRCYGVVAQAWNLFEYSG